jgi:hypothetical protein
MAKFDQELLKKHHFWFLFVPIVIGLVIAWSGLFFVVADDCTDKTTKNESEVNKTKQNQAQPRKTLDVFKEQLTELDKKKLVFWKDGWEKEKDVFVWPSGYSKDQLEVVKNLKFGDDIPDTASVRSQFAPKIYLDEYEQLIKTLQPMQFKDNDPKSVLTRDQQWGTTADSEDMWLAMEDLWVQRELLLAVHKVNVTAATLQKIASPDGKDDPKHRWFKNRTWELELWIDEQKGNRVLKGKLKNVSQRLQVMGVGNVMKLEVDLKLAGGKPFVFEVQGTTLEAGQKEPMLVQTIKDHAIPPELNVTEIAGVRQVFDARTVPVKRIDVIALGKLCDRNKDMPLRASLMSNILIKKERETNPPKTAAPPPGADTPPPAEGSVQPILSGDSPQSQNKLRRYRYLDVIVAKPPGQDKEVEQMRRMPVGIVVITDQSYMNDILDALLNIRLRMQLAQVEYTRFHETVDYRPNASGGATMPAPGAFGSTPTNSRDDQFSANLLQLSVYGVMSLYDTYDDKLSKQAPVKK